MHQVWEFHSFLVLRILLCIYTTFYLFICVLSSHFICLTVHLFIDTWVVYTFYLLYIMLLWTLYTNLSPCFHLFYIPRNGVTESHSYSMFSFLRNHQINYIFEWITYAHRTSLQKWKIIQWKNFFFTPLSLAFISPP